MPNSEYMLILCLVHKFIIAQAHCIILVYVFIFLILLCASIQSIKMVLFIFLFQKHVAPILKTGYALAVLTQ